MDCKLDIFEKFNVSYDWSTVYVGVKLNLINIDEVVRYATKVLSSDPDLESELLIELAMGFDELRSEEYLWKIKNEMCIDDISEETANWNIEKRKWRYCMLKNIRDSETNLENMLSKVSELYADMGYPVDMEAFIIYMPPKGDYDPSMHSNHDNISRLIRLFDDFLRNEKDFIGNK